MPAKRDVPLAERLVEVIADLGGDERRYGSGCIVAGRTVLTAAHVVTGARRVRVRGPDKRMLPCGPIDVRFVGDPQDISKGPDLALIEVDDPYMDLPPMPLARVNRDGDNQVERCHAWGYPQYAERVLPSGLTGVRETVDVAGVVPVGAGLVYGLLDLQVSVAPRDLPPTGVPLTESPWSGISGAPVIAAGALLGVVCEHARSAGASSLSVTPLTAITHDPFHEKWGPGVTDPRRVVGSAQGEWP